MSEEKLRDELQDADVAVENGEGGGSLAGEAEPQQQTEAQGRDLEKELADAKEEIAELRDRMLRMAADTDNYKKRMERERLQSLKYAGESIFREILPVIDNLERAVTLGSAGEGNTEKNFAALREGVELILKSLVSTLEKFEVKPVQSAGQPFDPVKHEAMVMEASDTVPANHVLTEFEKGYYYKDRLLRVAKVIVSSGAK